MSNEVEVDEGTGDTGGGRIVLGEEDEGRDIGAKHGGTELTAETMVGREAADEIDRGTGGSEGVFAVRVTGEETADLFKGGLGLNERGVTETGENIASFATQSSDFSNGANKLDALE